MCASLFPHPRLVGYVWDIFDTESNKRVDALEGLEDTFIISIKMESISFTRGVKAASSR